jgi:hypothetical protein
MVFSDFYAAKRYADHRGQRVGGTYDLKGNPQYFLHSPELEDQKAHDLSFEIRNGRRPTAYERWALEVAAKRHELVDA